MTTYAGDVITGVDSNGERASIQEGESCNVVGIFKDGGTTITKSALITVTASLFLESTGASINSRNDQDILDANQGTITSDGVFTLRLGPLDNIIVGSPVTDLHERHLLRVKWTWNDGVAVRNGSQDILLYVQQLRTVT